MIYIYGTCFSYNYKNSKPHAWYIRLQKYFRCEARNYSFNGVSFEWCFSKIDRTKHLWKPNDVILFTEPDLNRKWFFKRYPGISHADRISNTDRLSQQDKDFALLWLENYYNPRVEFLNLKAHYSLMNQSLHEKDVKCFVMQGYDRPYLADLSNISFSKGITLSVISNQEIKNYDKDELCGENFGRITHFSRENHIILAQQIYKAIKTDSNIDLSVDFERGIYEIPS